MEDHHARSMAIAIDAALGRGIPWMALHKEPRPRFLNTEVIAGNGKVTS